MPSLLLERLRQGYRTMAYPDGPPPELPKRWLGEPEFHSRLLYGIGKVHCPTGALASGMEPRLDIGRCIFCGECQNANPAGSVEFSRRYAMARYHRDDLVLGGGREKETRNETAGERLKLIRSFFGRSLKLRQVSAGGCNACEADCNVLGTPVWDMGRFGMSFVASPRHADGILVTGPVTDNMKLALEKTYAAVPEPKVVIAVGACAISGGIYGDGSGRGVLDGMLKVDLYIPGCPPHPLVVLEGLLRLLGRVPELA